MPSRSLIATLILLGAMATPAFAQAPGDLTGGPPGAHLEPLPPQKEMRTVSAGAALGLGALGTTAGVLLGIKLTGNGSPLLGATVFSIAPSLGHIYVGEHKTAWVTNAIRGAGLIAMVWGFSGSSSCYEHCGPQAPEISLLAGLVVAGTTVYSIFGPAAAADRINKRARGKSKRPKRLRPRFFPMLMSDSSGGRSMGIRAAAVF